MTNKAWGGRFRQDTDRQMLDFSESVSFDHRLAEMDIMGSMAHARMLGETGIITKDDAKSIIAGLEEVIEEVREGKLELKVEHEDIHMNVEVRLREKIGDAAGKLHTGRSRNDQICLDMKMHFRRASRHAIEAIDGLLFAIARQAELNIDAIMPGFTHTRKAQPILFSHHLMAYAEMLLRDRERFEDCRRRMNLSPLGSGAFAGTTFPIDREMTAKELGFDGVTRNSIDGVADRDFLIEFGAAASITMLHLSRMMEELIWWGLPEVGFVELPESFCTGSSMMPNKKNPDAAELVRGKSGRVLGALFGLMTVMKGTPLAYNRDLQEDKEGMFDAADTLIQCLVVSARLIAGMDVNAERMRESAKSGFVLATDLADYLATKGMPFREAHEVAGSMVAYCEDKCTSLEDMDLDEMREFSALFEKDVSGWMSLEAAVKRRNIEGGTAPERVKNEIERLKKILGSEEKE